MRHSHALFVDLFGSFLVIILVPVNNSAAASTCWPWGNTLPLSQTRCFWLHGVLLMKLNSALAFFFCPQIHINTTYPIQRMTEKRGVFDPNAYQGSWGNKTCPNQECGHVCRTQEDSNYIGQDPTIEWLHHFVCAKCNSRWSACGLCGEAEKWNKQLTTPRLLTTHKSLDAHKANVEHALAAVNKVEDTAAMGDAQEPLTQSQLCRSLLTGSNDEFFHHEVEERTSGSKFLAGKALYKKGFAATTHIAAIDKDEAILDLRVACLVNGLTRTQVKDVVEINMEMYRLGMKHKEEDIGQRTEEMMRVVEDHLATYLPSLPGRAKTSKRSWKDSAFTEDPNTSKHSRKDSAFTEDLLAKINDCRPTHLSKDVNTKRITPAKDYPNCRPRYLRGKESYVDNIPRPIVQGTAVESHAVIKIADCIRDAYAHGFPMETITAKSFVGKQSDEFEWITESPRAREIWMESINNMEGYENGKVDGVHFEVMPLLFWSDDCEPNSSIGKSNRGSSHLITATLGTPRVDRNSINNTYPVAVSGKKASHEPAYGWFDKEIKQINEKGIVVYSKTRGEAVRVKVAVFARLADQPERRGENGLMAGNSTSHVRYRVSGDHKQLAKFLAPCENCYNLLKAKRLGETAACSVCVCWDIVGNKENMDLSLTPSADYPKRDDFTGDCPFQYLTMEDKVLPFEMSYERLVLSAEYAHEQLMKGHWTVKKTQAFLSRENMNTKLVEKITEAAVLCRVNNEHAEGQHSGLDAVRLAALEQLEWMDPKPHPLPILWRTGETLAVFVDVIMHILFLGVVKTLMLHIQSFLSQQNSNARFVRNVQSPGGMNEMLDNWCLRSLSWLRLAPYRGEKFGGWVSENYLAFSRISLWFYQNVPDICGSKEDAPAEEDDEPPNTDPPAGWNVKHYRRWLRDRRMEASGLKPVLHKRVVEAMSLPEPPTIGKPIAEHSPDQVRATLVALQDMLAEIMTTRVDSGTVERMETQIKMFLSEFEKLDQSIRTSKDPMKLVSCFNFLCLLNLPTATALFGPLRNLWEGGVKGEALISLFKEQICMGLRMNWERNSLKGMLKTKSLKTMLSTVKEEVMAVDQHVPCWEKTLANLVGTDCNSFPSRQSVVDALKHGHPLSVLCLVDGETNIFFAVVDVGAPEPMSLWRIEKNPEGARPKFGLNYSPWEMASGEGLGAAEMDAWFSLSKPGLVVAGAILLPLVDMDPVNKGMCKPQGLHTVFSQLRYSV